MVKAGWLGPPTLLRRTPYGQTQKHHPTDPSAKTAKHPTTAEGDQTAAPSNNSPPRNQAGNTTIPVCPSPGACIPTNDPKLTSPAPKTAKTNATESS